MENLELETLLNQKTANEFGFKLKSARLEKASSLCFVEFFYNDGTILTSEKRKIAESVILENLPQGFEYQIKFIKNFVVNEAVSSYVKDFFKHNFPAILYNLKNIDCENQEKKVLIGVQEKVEEYVISRKVAKTLEEQLKKDFLADFSVEIIVDDDYQEVTIIEEDLDFSVFDPTENDERVIEVLNVEPLIGDFKDNLAFYIKDKKVPEENVVLCGRILYIKEYAYQVKSKKKEETENKENAQEEQTEEQNKGERKYFKFTIEDFTGKLSCVFFANKNNLETVQKLEPGNSVILEGKLEADNFSGGVSMRVKNISLCTLPEAFEEKIAYKKEPKNYRYVFPEKVEMYAQSDLFMVDKKPVDEFLLNNDIVVFDFETTGLKLDGSDKIIEIGAVKVEKGKITEKFECFVNPEMHIPLDASKIHGIYDKDVKGANTYDQVLADFYKFTRNCYLSGYNIKGFDMLFLRHFGKLSGYNFDNPLIDVYPIAQKLVVGVKNYKLGTVAEKLGVLLDNAHRAVYDTIATAEVLIKLSEISPIKV